MRVLHRRADTSGRNQRSGENQRWVCRTVGWVNPRRTGKVAARDRTARSKNSPNVFRPAANGVAKNRIKLSKTPPVLFCIGSREKVREVKELMRACFAARLRSARCRLRDARLVEQGSHYAITDLRRGVMQQKACSD